MAGGKDKRNFEIIKNAYIKKIENKKKGNSKKAGVLALNKIKKKNLCWKFVITIINKDDINYNIKIGKDYEALKPLRMIYIW